MVGQQLTGVAYVKDMELAIAMQSDGDAADDGVSATATIVIGTTVSRPLRHWIHGNACKRGSRRRQRHFTKAWPVRSLWLASWAKLGFKSYLRDQGQ